MTEAFWLGNSRVRLRHAHSTLMRVVPGATARPMRLPSTPPASSAAAQGARLRLIDRNQQPARRLRVVQQVDEVPLDTRGDTHAAGKVVTVGPGPPGMLPGTSARAPSSSGTRPAWISSVHPLAIAISEAWPIRPNPVMSVQACTTPGATAPRTSAAALFRAAIDRVAASIAAGGARPNFSAVAMMPVPIGLVRISASPGLAPAFARTRAGSTSPVIA